MIAELVIGAVAETLGRAAETISLADDLSDDLGADQRDVTDIIELIERRSGIALPTDLEDARTVGDLVAAVKSLERGAAARGG
jgi:acyl carrier protein